MFDLIYEKIPEGWLITGQTYHMKDNIKSFGGRWVKEKQAWFLVDIQELKEYISIQRALNNFQLEKFRIDRLKSKMKSP